MCPKLGRHLLIKKGSQDRQRAKPAIQLLSSTSADVALRLFPEDKKMKKFARFVRDIDEFWDTVNSSTKHHSYKPLKSGFRGLILVDTYLLYLV